MSTHLQVACHLSRVRPCIAALAGGSVGNAEVSTNTPTSTVTGTQPQAYTSTQQLDVKAAEQLLQQWQVRAEGTAGNCECCVCSCSSMLDHTPVEFCCMIKNTCKC